LVAAGAGAAGVEKAAFAAPTLEGFGGASPGFGLGAGGAASGRSGLLGAGAAAGKLADFSPADGLASSSAMIRRIDARISSIEGSWTFAGCVISDSKSSTPSHALFYTKHDGIGRFRVARAPQFLSQATLVPRSAARIIARLRPCSEHRSVMVENALRAPRIAWLPTQRLCHGN
jgi:hypothetical protein